MYSITITITCNHKNQRLQITFRLLKTCNRLHVITITDYNYNRSDYKMSKFLHHDDDADEARAMTIPHRFLRKQPS